MWTINVDCPRCCKKDRCKDRVAIIQTLSPLTARLNTEAELVESPGDGIIIVACQGGFAVAE